MLTKPFSWSIWWLLFVITTAHGMDATNRCDDCDLTSMLQLAPLPRQPPGPGNPPGHAGAVTTSPLAASSVNFLDNFLDVADPMPWEGLKSQEFTAAAAGGPSTKANAAFERDWLLVYALLVLMFLAISPIVAQKGCGPVLLVVAYLASLTLVKLLVKRTITLGFPYPDSITAIHMAAVTFTAACFERPRRGEASHVLPISLVSGASLLANNTALLYGGVAFVSMIHANVPFFTFSIELLKGRRSLTDVRSCLAVLLVCAGSAFCVSGEVLSRPTTSVPLALAFATASAMLRSLRGVWQEEVVCETLSPMRLVFWNGIWSLMICVPLMIVSEGAPSGISRVLLAPKEAQWALLSSTVAGVVLNVTQVLAIKQLGALMQSIVGNLNLILVIALSQAWLHEEVALFQHFGIILLATGTFVNKIEPMKSPETDMDKRFREALRIISAASPRSCLVPVEIASAPGGTPAGTPGTAQAATDPPAEAAPPRAAV